MSRRREFFLGCRTALVATAFMGKRKLQGNKNELNRKRLKNEQDALLEQGLFDKALSHTSEQKWEDVEQDYEMVPRASYDDSKIVEGLPTKNADGKITRNLRKVELETHKSEDEADLETATEVEITQEANEEEKDPYAHLPPAERLTLLKEEIAELSSSLLEDPESNFKNLTRLRKMSESKNFATSQLATSALIPVFKALAPSYCIRPLTDAEKREKVSKEVARLRQFEQSLAMNYCQFVDHLATLAKISVLNSRNNKSITSQMIKRGSLACKVACELSTSSLRFFNHRNELFKLIIRRLNRRPLDPDDLEVFNRCLRTLETLLKEDEESGEISLEVTRLLCKTLREKKFRVDESVINIFLSLSLLNDYDPNGNKEADDKPKLKKKDRVHLSKKERKARKERIEIEAEMNRAEQVVTAAEREKFQAQALKELLTLYLNILKAGALGSDNGTATKLIAPVLEGLSRYGRMANFDLLGDFLEVLREILDTSIEELNSAGEGGIDDNNDDSNRMKVVLLCVVTSFSLVTNNASVGKLPISLDLSKFVTSLYTIISEISLDCDLELSLKSLRLADPLAGDRPFKPSVNVSTRTELLLRCLDSIFFGSKNGTASRASAFTKRLYITILQIPEKSSLALLKFVGKLVSRYDESIKGLWNTEERIDGNGVYNLGIERNGMIVDLDRSKSEAATLWENVLLDKHYSPMVRDGARSLFKNSKLHDKT